MSLLTSTDFTSASATGTDWRDTSKAVLEQLDSIRTEDDGFNFGFLYISDHLADDAKSIYTLFRSVLKIESWIGSVGIGVINGDEALIDKPSISAMIGRFPEGSFCVFPKDEQGDALKTLEDLEDKDSDSYDITEENLEQQGPRYLAHDVVEQWLIEHTPMLGVVHADPLTPMDLPGMLSEMTMNTHCFFVGGVTSSRTHHYQIADNVYQGALCGAFFSDNVQVSTAISQGCIPLGGFHSVTKVSNNTVLELDDRPAVEILRDDLSSFAAAKMGESLGAVTGSFDPLKPDSAVSPELQKLFRGRVHFALSLPTSDKNDFFIRDFTEIDLKKGSISTSDTIDSGQNLFFAQRNEHAISSDLSKTLIDLRNRVMAERGCFEPKGGLYVSCIARGVSKKNPEFPNELHLIRDIIGDIPLCGFYASAGINNAHLYNHTGIITLFF